MDFIQELVIAVELSECLGVAIALTEDGLVVAPDFAARTVSQLQSFLKPFKCKGLSKLRKDALVRLAIALWTPQEVAKRKPRKGSGKRKRA